MDLSAAGELARVSCYPEPFIRLDGSILDLEEAKAATSALYEIIERLYIWDWPSAERHLLHKPVNTGDAQDVDERQQDSDEDDEQYNERMQRLEAWPRVRCRETSRVDEVRHYRRSCARLSPASFICRATSKVELPAITDTTLIPRSSMSTCGYVSTKGMVGEHGRKTRSIRQNPSQIPALGTGAVQI